MSFRFRALAAHLGISVVLLALILVTLYVGWYRWPAWYLLQVETIVALLVLVDIGLGPLATFVVTSPRKPPQQWRRDLAAIVVVQLLALGYGSYAIWAGRPLFYAFSVDRIEVVQASAFKEPMIDSARRQNAAILPEWYSLPRWVGARLPDEPEKRNAITTSAIFDGADVTVMPEYFRPWGEDLPALRQVLIPLDRLIGHKRWDAAEYRKHLARLNRPEASLGLLPAKGNRRDGAWVFDRETGEPLAFWPVEIWGLREE